MPIIYAFEMLSIRFLKDFLFSFLMMCTRISLIVCLHMAVETGSDPLELELQVARNPPIWVLGPSFGSSS